MQKDIIQKWLLKTLVSRTNFSKKICFGTKGFPFTYSKSNKKISYKKGTVKVCKI